MRARSDVQLSNSGFATNSIRTPPRVIALALSQGYSVLEPLSLAKGECYVHTCRTSTAPRDHIWG